MISDLTDYLRSLGAGGEPPGPADYEAAKELLRAVLVREMVRRGLWNAPPSYLGVLGARRWTRELLDELVVDCYVEIFLRRLPALENQLLVRSEVDGLVVRCVRNFLHDRQRTNDPLGYKVYELLRDSLRRLQAAGALRLGDRASATARIGNRTVCAFTAGAGSREPAPVDLEGRVRVWNDDLWPELLTAQGRARTEVHERLDGHISRLAETGVASFYFRDLVEPMKRDVRRRWSEELADLAQEMTSSGDSEGGPGFRELRDCVLAKLEKEPADRRENLRKLWLFLWTYAAGLNPSEAAAKAERGGRAPAELGVANELGIGRHLLRPLKETLGRLIRACQSAIPPKAPVMDLVGLDLMNLTDRDRRLRDATGQAAARWAAGREKIEGDLRPPRPADLVVLPASHGLLVEWLVVEEEIESGRLLAVAVDDGTEVGSRDVAVSAEEANGLLRVHCAAELWLDVDAVDLRWRAGELPQEALAEVRRKRSAILDGTLVRTMREQEVESDPEYRRRMEELEEVRAKLATAPEKPARLVAFRPRDRQKNWAPWALAASILLSVVLGGGLIYQQRLLSFLEERSRPTPHLNLPVFWLTAEESERGAGDPLVVSSDARRVALILEVASPEKYPRYRVEITEGASNAKVWTSDELVKIGSELSFDLPRSSFSTGPYELRIYGLPTTDEPTAESGPDLAPVLLQRTTVWIELQE